MRTFLIIGVLALFFVLPAQAELQDLGPANDFKLKLYGGGNLQLSKALEKGPVLLDFWATWCAPCKKALPHYQKLYEKYAEQGFQVIAVSQDDPRSQPKIGAFFKSQKLDLPCVLDSDKQVGRKWRVQVLPTSFLIDTEGNIRMQQVGFIDGHERELEKYIRELLNLEPEADDAR